MKVPFTISRFLKAPRQLVWDVYSQQEHIPHWLGPKGSNMPYCKLDFREGGTLAQLLGPPPPDRPAGGQTCPNEGILVEASGKP